jgi:hypothetical protein
MSGGSVRVDLVLLPLGNFKHPRRSLHVRIDQGGGLAGEDDYQTVGKPRLYSL